MPDSAIEGVRWEPVGLEDYMGGKRYFSAEAVADVVEKTGRKLPSSQILHTTERWNATTRQSEHYSLYTSRPTHLRRALEAQAHWYWMETRWFAEPRNADVADALDDIVTKCGDLLLALGAEFKEGNGLPDAVPYKVRRALTVDSGQQPLQTAIDGAIKLRGLAVESAKEKREASEPARKGRPPDEAAVALIERLARIYEEVFERPPGSGDSGPFVQFVTAFFKKAAITAFSDGALAGKVKRVVLNMRKIGAKSSG